ncbi:helix-turn-helix domain-containing protein [Sporosarcina sp. 6E9]|uniref:helix-turn-helix domain-containing protein n=1 Tax=Sporosarcina sp. 6E9 TaxID=2819235 RepID=UPI001B310837|nr:helix-turn-helix domain-containing protein [Sporosarcina sp. 6E9]
MIVLEIDQKQLKDLYLQKVEEKLKELESEVFFMNSKQLCGYLNMSWNTIVDSFLYDDEFPSLRVGTKWLFNKKEVQKYMEKYYEELKYNGKDILKYQRKG